jgi:hypothetical protein
MVEGERKRIMCAQQENEPSQEIEEKKKKSEKIAIALTKHASHRRMLTTPPKTTICVCVCVCLWITLSGHPQ